MLRIHNRSGNVIHSRWENAPRSLARLPGASSLQLSSAARSRSTWQQRSCCGCPTPARQSQGPAAQARFPSLFLSCSSFLCSSPRTRMNLPRLTRAWGGGGGGSHLPSQTTLTLEGSTALQTRLPTKSRPGIAKKPEVKPNIWTSIFLNSIFFKI